MPKIPAPKGGQAQNHPDFAMRASEPRLAGVQKIFLLAPQAIEFSEFTAQEICRFVDISSGVVPNFLYETFLHYFGDFGKTRDMGGNGQHM
jgi:hypothetical protein